MDDLELIKQKLNIVDVIQEYIPLKKAGVNFKASCPFHKERTPSFMVSPERGIFHCFGCGIGGDIFKFLMEKEGIEFKDALEILAKKAGITFKGYKKEKNFQDRLYEVNLKAQQFFHYILTEHSLGKEALGYLKKRCLTDETIKLFGLGYAPLNWESLCKFLKKRGFSEEEIIKVGLAIPSKKVCYDRFRGRIIFPLIDGQDRIVGFSGRILDKGEPKYINTPQTLIFDKSKFLFGLNMAKADIRSSKEAIIVEGELDMILSFQTGVKNIVSSKGTALTEGQLELLKKQTETISLCFDADLAGDAASRRGIEIADKLGLNIKVIEIKEAKDPAELCIKDESKWFESIKAATPIYDYYLESVTKRYNIKVASDKKAIYNELIPIWGSITDPITKEHYIQKLSSLLQVKDEIIRDGIKKSQSAKSLSSNLKYSVLEKSKKDDKLPSPDRRKLLEEYLVALLLHLPSSITYVPNFPESLFTEERLKQIYVMLVLFLDQISFQGRSFTIVEFNKSLPPDLVNIVDRLYLMQIDEKLQSPVAWQKELELCISELKRMLIKASLEKLSLAIKQAQSFDKIEALENLNKRFRDLSVKLKNL